jgi:hypothetical protein
MNRLLTAMEADPVPAGANPVRRKGRQSSPFFGPYISKTITTLDVSGTPISKQVEQAIDVWGNMTSMKGN